MNWDGMKAEYGDGLVDAMRFRLLSGSSPQIDKAPFVMAGHESGTVDALFDRLLATGVLELHTIRRCPDCKTELDKSVTDDGVCQLCDYDMGEAGKKPLLDVIFLASHSPSREIPWLVALHGFNTHGDWQEEFGWLLSTRFRHRAPALMYKFPFLFLGVLLRRRHEALAAELDRKLRLAIARAAESGISEPPDIIAHSFGTLLLVRLLDRPESADLRFGRVILAGSIVAPDYDWSRWLRDKRIEAVLNHCSARDFVVELAQWVIPEAGPSGRIGFDDGGAVNYREQAFGHGTHFEADTMVASLRHDGLWETFLRLPASSLREAIGGHIPPSRWRRPWKLLTAASRIVAIALASLVIAPTLVIVNGVRSVVRGTI